MPKTLPMPPPGFDELPADEKLQYLEALWDRIAAVPEDVGVPDWHRQLVSERLAEYHHDPEAGRAWREVREELLRELSGRKPTTR